MDISAELAEIASYQGFFALTVGGTAAGWHPVRRSYADGFADLVEATARRYRTTDLRIGASLVHLGHATRLWSPVLACALAHGVVPDLGDLQRAGDGAQLRLPAPAGFPARSPDTLYRAVVREHMQPLAAGLRVKLAPALLAGNLASALVGAARALLAARPDLDLQIAETTRALLSTGVLAGSGVVTGPRLAFRRRSCCLFYRLPGGTVCGDCVFETQPPDRPRAPRRLPPSRGGT
ncbi:MULTISPECIES: (2Fe-2S)-binding protein [unclassified Mycobacterium]|uniref:(2Fe-2S)-binding protein n=1 Tax=unclassified Mycobacterium TaxID=2642494 RepID=UPI0009EF3F46|nr:MULTISPECIES: (2Fe-2S)-binding protein [unclassified Mycobacterium]